MGVGKGFDFISTKIRVVDYTECRRISWVGLRKPVDLIKTPSLCFMCIDRAKTHNGYVKITVKGKTYRLHKFMYCLKHRIPYESLEGKVLLHDCDNRLCCNPDHLILGTHEENMADMVAKGRSASGERNTNAKLTRDIISAIKSVVHDTCSAEIAALAEEYGVKPKTIKRVINGETWKHV